MSYSSFKNSLFGLCAAGALVAGLGVASASEIPHTITPNSEASLSARTDGNLIFVRDHGGGGSRFVMGHGGGGGEFHGGGFHGDRGGFHGEFARHGGGHNWHRGDNGYGGWGDNGFYDDDYYNGYVPGILGGLFASPGYDYYGPDDSYVPLYEQPGTVVPYRVMHRAAPANHANWCASHYRTYRFSDNTYQPTHGPRAVCR